MRSSLSTRERVPVARYEVPVKTPYRLDLTAAVLRRLSTNVVDTLDEKGVYRRAFATPRGPVVLAVAQPVKDRLCVTVTGTARRAWILALVRRMFAPDLDVGPFLRASENVPLLRGIATRMRGVHPPRYPTLWEACVNAVVFQQVSLFAAGAMMRRLVERLGSPHAGADGRLYAFPSPAVVAAAGADVLRSAGLSAAKATALLGIAAALENHTVREQHLERRPSDEAAALLRTCRGIGPWTAAIILLRGLGRLDVFPEKDSGAARSLALLEAGQPIDVPLLLNRLGAWRGMVYYHLLLARLEARGDLPSPPRWK